MISSEEMTIFIEELYSLIQDYKRCNDTKLKKQIHDEILVLSEIIDPNTSFI